ncbi:phage terminase large subunit [Gammaproteobacteria bacterium]
MRPATTTAPAAPFLLSPKQLDYFRAPDRRINILDGSIRSGKTFASLLKWSIKEVAPAPRHYEYLMSGKTLTTLKRNCLAELRGKVGTRNFNFSLTAKEGTLFGHRVWLEGANDERSEEKIHGSTFGGAYCDEFALYPESFVDMLLGRMSLEGAKLYATCNPENPRNFVKRRFLDATNLDVARWRFLIDDNPFLGKDYVANIKKEYAGTIYEKRYILGLWCQAEGVVYPVISATPGRVVIKQIDKTTVKYVIIGVDFGGHKSGDAFIAVGITNRGPVILDEYHRTGIKTPEELTQAFVAFVRKQRASGYKVYEAFVDSAEQTLKAGLEAAAIKERLVIDIRNARKGPITDRIHLVNLLVGRDQFKILEHCRETIEAFQQAIWNDKVDKDERLDDGTVNIDVLDAAEYALESVADILIVGAK